MLSDGEAHTHRELYALGTVAHSRVAELRKRGYVIEGWREEHAGETVYFYRLLSVPTQDSSPPRPGADAAGQAGPGPDPARVRESVEGEREAAAASPSEPPEQLVGAAA